MTVTDTSQRRRFLARGNVYLPHIAVIEKIIDETPTVMTFHFNFKDDGYARSSPLNRGNSVSTRSSALARLPSVFRPAQPDATTWSLLYSG